MFLKQISLAILFFASMLIALDEGKILNKFEASLTPKEIQFITQENPNSFYRKLGTFQSSYKAMDCTQKDYEKLKSELGLEKLVSIGDEVMTLSYHYELQYFKSYFPRIFSIIEKRTIPQADKEILKKNYAIEVQDLKLLDTYSKTRIPENEASLINKGLPKSKIKDFVVTTAIKSPQCLFGVHIPFYKMRKKDLMMERGKYLLTELQKQIMQTGIVPENSYKLPIKEGHPIYGSYSDPYGNFYIVKKEGRNVVLYSQGESPDDAKVLTKIGSIEIKK